MPMNKSLFLPFSIVLNLISFAIAENGYSGEPLPKEERHCVVYGELDYLLWFANQSGLHYPTTATGSSPHLNSNWDSGVRATIGVQPSRWDTRLAYTYYSTHSNDQVSANPETILTSYPSTAGVFKVSAKWSLNFNRLDWEVGRKILFGRNFSLRPFFSLEGLDADQKFHLNTKTISLDLSTGLPLTDVINAKNKNSLLSIGVRAGFNAGFRLGAGFEFYGNLAGSILWGQFKLKQHYNQTDFYSPSGSATLVDQSKHLSQKDSIFNCDLGIGFDWKHHFEKSKLDLLLTFGWEQHFYTDMLRFQDFYLQQVSAGTADYSSNGNLSLSGFSFGVALGY